MAADSGTVAGEFCANHPDRPTALRCNKCAKLICPGCALHTPVGYRCPQCVRGQQAVFETAHWYDYVTAAVTALVLSGLAGVLLSRLGWLLLFLAPTAGGALAEVVRRVVQRRRGRYLPHTVVAAMVLAALPALSLWMLLYVGLAGAAVFARLRGSLI
ncbi:hypothetical protein LBMAG37_16050 [Anaerolineae bacterium]|nr:hypothetical protein EMGBS3_07330 [Anaerolineaceae bacterium]GDX68450.1 hypothetical protein LBMAG37_16050 [Anaerolineae bacterium]